MLCPLQHKKYSLTVLSFLKLSFKSNELAVCQIRTLPQKFQKIVLFFFSLQAQNLCNNCTFKILKKKKQNRGHLYGFKNYAIIEKIIQQSLE